MVDILHRIGILADSPAPVYDALATAAGVAGWWTEDAAGGGAVGTILDVRFPPVGGFDLEVIEQVPSVRVAWRVVDGPPEWVGTTIEWDLRQVGEYVVVLFAHRGWAEPVEFMNHCSTKWATFLLSLKSSVESGAGSPAPGDVRISDWH